MLASETYSGFKKPPKVQRAVPSRSALEKLGRPLQPVCTICPGFLLACRDKVLAGADLLQELQSLQKDTEVGEAQNSSCWPRARQAECEHV